MRLVTSAMRSSTAAANSDVPIKTTLTGLDLQPRPLGGARRPISHRFPVPRASRACASLRASRENPVEDQDAVEVVDLVLDHPRLEPLGLDLELLAGLVLAPARAPGPVAPPRHVRPAGSGTPPLVAFELLALPLEHRV